MMESAGILFVSSSFSLAGNPVWINVAIAAALAVLVAVVFWFIWQEADSKDKEKAAAEPTEPEYDEDGLETKPFLDHLEDLRRVVLQSVGAWALTTTLCFLFTPQLIGLLMWPLLQTTADIDPATFLWTKGVIDPFLIQLQTGLFAGFALALPAVLYFLASFVLPALRPEEKRFLLPTFIAGAGLFVGGVLFCYFILLPVALDFFLQYNTYIGTRPMWTFYDYIGFVLQMLIAFGISFELPLVLLVLNVLGIVTSEMLAKYRRHSFVGIVIFAACITPTSDVFSLALLSLPMYALYEMTVWITRVREARAAKVEADEEAKHNLEVKEYWERRKRDEAQEGAAAGKDDDV